MQSLRVHDEVEEPEQDEGVSLGAVVNSVEAHAEAMQRFISVWPNFQWPLTALKRLESEA